MLRCLDQWAGKDCYRNPALAGMERSGVCYGALRLWCSGAHPKGFDLGSHVAYCVLSQGDSVAFLTFSSALFPLHYHTVPHIPPHSISLG